MEDARACIRHWRHQYYNALWPCLWSMPHNRLAVASPRGLLTDPTGRDRRGSRPALSSSGVVISPDDSMAWVRFLLPRTFDMSYQYHIESSHCAFVFVFHRPKWSLALSFPFFPLFFFFSSLCTMLFRRLFKATHYSPFCSCTFGSSLKSPLLSLAIKRTPNQENGQCDLDCSCPPRAASPHVCGRKWKCEWGQIRDGEGFRLV